VTSRTWYFGANWALPAAETNGLGELGELSGIPAYIWPGIFEDLDRYSEEHKAEACGMVVSWRLPTIESRVWSWKLLSNLLQGEEARHRFEMDAQGLRVVLADLQDLIEGRVHALIHSHPFPQSGDAGDAGSGPSQVDLLNRRSAERDARADGGVLPDSLLWLPKAGPSGIVMGYNGEGETWRLTL
jgi:hypothetical protein